MDIKSRIRQRLDEMNVDDLSHEERKHLDNISGKPKLQYKLVYHFQDIPLKAKTEKKAKEEAIKYALDNGFKPHHATLKSYYQVNLGLGRMSTVEKTIRLPFMP